MQAFLNFAMVDSMALGNRTYVAILAVLIIAGGAYALMRQDSPKPVSAHVTVGATILPLADIVRNVAGITINVVQLVPSGASPHSYNYTPQDIAALQDAKALFVIGHNLDDWSARAAAQAIQAPIVPVDSNIQLHAFGEDEEAHTEDDGHDHEEGSLDPHYWLSVPNAKIIATNVAATLSEVDPLNASTYARNLADYHKELDSLERDLQQQAALAKRKQFIAMHDAWSYFAEQYGFELVGTYEPVEGQEPSVTDINHLRELIDQYDLTTFYAEPQKHSSSATNFLAQEFGVNIAILDPEGSALPGVNTYSSLMLYNMRQLTK